jgi:hypothetical protein
MNTMSIKWMMTVWLLLSLPSFAVPPPMPDAARERLATLIVTGTVVKKVETRAESEGVIHVDGIAEIVVESIDKGSGVALGETLMARYFREVPSESTLQSRTTSGHREIPHETERVQVFMVRTQNKGFDVLLPNGFHKIGQ